jgi:hypothetical protein
MMDVYFDFGPKVAGGPAAPASTPTQARTPAVEATMSYASVAAHFRVKESTVRQWVRKGLLPGARDGRIPVAQIPDLEWSGGGGR